MRYALLNPNWDFKGSIYFGCTQYHLPLEFGYSKRLLEHAGHDARIFDAHLENLRPKDLVRRLASFMPDITVISTAPTYLFWRCAQPEISVPMQFIEAIRPIAGTIAVVGPHGSVTPEAVIKKLNVDAVVLGECEEILPLLSWPRSDWHSIPSICYRDGAHVRIQGLAHASDMNELEALHWPDEFIKSHSHQHHRFDAKPAAPGAEMEASRGCPFHCSFCAKHSFRDRYRKRPLEVVMQEIDGLISQGVEYIYFIDEIFLPDNDLLQALTDRPVSYGIQTRVDSWPEDMLDKLGISGCASVEVGIESITEEGRNLLNKNCRLTTSSITELLIRAKETIPFVQATLMSTAFDRPDEVEQWRQYLQRHGVWANKPVPVFPYPGSLEYARRWGSPDEFAWQRAHDYYLKVNSEFSDIQEQMPLRLSELETTA